MFCCQKLSRMVSKW